MDVTFIILLYHTCPPSACRPAIMPAIMPTPMNYSQVSGYGKRISQSPIWFTILA